MERLFRCAVNQSELHGITVSVSADLGKSPVRFSTPDKAKTYLYDTCATNRTGFADETIIMEASFPVPPIEVFSDPQKFHSGCFPM
jgi:hypothetical protein